MFEKEINYPCAISDFTEEGMKAALEWVYSQLGNGEKITLWVTQKNVITGNDLLTRLSRNKQFLVSVDRGGSLRAEGPVLAMYPSSTDLGLIVKGNGITALCVVPWSDRLDTWVTETESIILHSIDFEPDYYEYEEKEPDLDPQITERLQKISGILNLNNSISGGYNKTYVVKALLSLHDSGLTLPPKRLAEWAAAHGWGGKSPKILSEYAEKINNGSRPRTR